MAGNPLIDQGVVNLTKASVNWADYAALAVTAPYLGPGGITLAKEGSASVQLPTATGVVQSPNPYMMVNVTMMLLRTQGLAAAYQLQFQTYTPLGDCTVRPDLNEGTGILPYDLTNCALDNVREMVFNGKDPGFSVSFHGVWIINNALFD